MNGLIDYLLLLTTARLAGIPLRRKRYAIAALFGAGYAAAAFFPCGRFLTTPVAKTTAGLWLALIAFGREKRLLRLILLLMLISCGFAGCILGLSLLANTHIPTVNGIFYTDLDGRALLVGAAAIYVVLTIAFRTAARFGMNGYLLPVRVSISGRISELTALWDTGNTLHETVGGRPVLVALAGSLDRVLPPKLSKILTEEQLKDPVEALEKLQKRGLARGLQLLPYRAVGVTGGLLLAIRSDWVEIQGQRYDGLLVAMTPSLGGTGYTALWGGQIGRRGKRNASYGHTTIFDSTGTSSGF